jgi:transcriptional regulator with XRE-family HTH domain
MPVPLSEMMEKLPPERRAKIERHAQALIAEHRSIAQIRKALKLTQTDVAKALKTSQANVAQIEGKKDVLVSTLARVVKAMGGELELVVTIPNRGRAVLEIGKAKGEPVVRPKRKKKPRTAVTTGSTASRRPKAAAA